MKSISIRTLLTRTMLTRTLPGFVVLTLLVASVMPATSAADHRDGQRCWNVFGTIDVRLFTTGCDSVVGLCTQGSMRAFPFLNGSTRFRATGLGGGAVGEASIVTPAVEPSTTWSYSGELVVSAGVGDLVLEDVGVLDNVRGTFAETNRVVGGTGLLSEASGDLFMFGHVDDDGGGFSGGVRGRICVPSRRDR